MPGGYQGGGHPGRVGRAGIELEGDRALMAQLQHLIDIAPRKVISSAFRKSCKRIKAGIISNASGAVATKRTGNLIRGWKATKIKSSKRSRRMVQMLIEMPTRAAMGISPGDPYYYPVHLEYGHGNVKPFPVVRNAVNSRTSSELSQIARDIGDGIIKEAARKKGKK